MQSARLVALCCLLCPVLPIVASVFHQEPAQEALQDPEKDPEKDPKKGAKQPLLERVQPPASRPPLRPVQDPPRTAVERKDLMQQFTPSSPLMGFYKLTSVTTSHTAERHDNHGYLFIGRRHLMMDLQLMGPSGKPEFFHSGVRQYTLNGDVLSLVNLMGSFKAGPKQELVVEPRGAPEVRRVQLVGSTLRIFRTGGRIMEFTRVE